MEYKLNMNIESLLFAYLLGSLLLTWINLNLGMDK